MSSSSGRTGGPVHAAAPFLEGLQHDDLAGKIHPAYGQRQRFGQPAAGIVQDVTERADLTQRRLGRIEEDGAFVVGEVEAVPGGDHDPQAEGARRSPRRALSKSIAFNVLA